MEGPWDEGREKKNAEGKKEKEGRKAGRGTEMR